MGWRPEVWGAIYAACVATGALLLQLRTWVKSGPRLRLTVIPDGLIIGGDKKFDEEDLVIVTAINVGTADTMITNLAVEKRHPSWQFWRRTPCKEWVIMNPQLKGYPSNVPELLKPAHTWTGVVRNRPDLFADIRDGSYCIALHTSTHREPFVKRIQVPRHIRQRADA